MTFVHMPALTHTICVKSAFSEPWGQMCTTEMNEIDLLKGEDKLLFCGKHTGYKMSASSILEIRLQVYKQHHCMSWHDYWLLE